MNLHEINKQLEAARAERDELTDRPEVQFPGSTRAIRRGAKQHALNAVNARIREIDRLREYAARIFNDRQWQRDRAGHPTAARDPLELAGAE